MSVAPAGMTICCAFGGVPPPAPMSPPEPALSQRTTCSLYGLMVRLRLNVAEPSLFVAVMVTARVPAVVGVPEMTPVSGLSVSPGLSPVAVKVGFGVPVTVTV